MDLAEISGTETPRFQITVISLEIQSFFAAVFRGTGLQEGAFHFDIAEIFRTSPFSLDLDPSRPILGQGYFLKNLCMKNQGARQVTFV